MLRRAALALLYVVALTLTLAIAALFHVSTPPGRRAARDVTNAVLAPFFKGRIHIGSIDALEPFGELHPDVETLRASDVSLTDSDGVEIVSGGIATLARAPHGIGRCVVFSGTPACALYRVLARKPGAAMPPLALEVRRARMRFVQHRFDDGTTAFMPSIGVAFLPRTPAPPAPPGGAPGIRFYFPRLELRVHELVSELGGFVATAHDVDALGAVDTLPISVHAALAPASLTSDRTPPVQARGAFDWDSRFVRDARTNVDRDLGRMTAVADLSSPEVHCHAEMLREGETLTLRARGCRAPAAVVDRAAGAPLGIDADIAELTAVTGADGRWRISAAGAANAQRFEVALDASGLDFTAPNVDATADVTLHALDPSRVLPTLPAGALDGRVHAERHGERLVLDTTALRAVLGGAPVPPVRAEARLRGTHLWIDALRSPTMDLGATGEVDFADVTHTARLDAHVRAPDLGALPFVERRAHGAVRAELHLRNNGRELRARIDAHAAGLRAGGLRARAAEVHGTAMLDGPRLEVNGDVRADGLEVPQFGLLDVRAHVAGDPRAALDAVVHAQSSAGASLGGGPAGAAGPTRIDARVHAELSPQRVRVAVARAPVLLRGASGVVEGDLVIPMTAGGRLAGRVHLRTDTGGEADVRIAGADVTGRFTDFPLEWVGRATGLSVPLAGRLSGSLDTLTNRAARARAELHWTDARLPYLGEFDLVLTADHRGDVSAYDAELTLGPNRRTAPPSERETVRLTARALPPSALGDWRGWLMGLRDARVDATRLPLAILDPLVPHSATLRGTASAFIAIGRARPGEPLETVLGLEVRNAVLDANIAGAGPSAIRDLVRRSVGPQPLTVPLRVRAAVCGQLHAEDLRELPLALDAVIAREVGEPVSAPPASCSEGATAARERIVRAFGTAGGRWLDAAKGTLAAVTAAMQRGVARLADVSLPPATQAALSAAPVDLTVSVGPLPSTRWPFTPAMRFVVPALAAAPVSGTASFTVRALGAMFGPTVTARAGLYTDEVEALSGHDALELEATAALAPRTVGGALFGPVDINVDGSARLLAHTAHGPEPAGTARAEVRTHGELARVLDPDQRTRALDVERLRLETSRFQIGRLRWVRQHAANGLLTLAVRETGDPITPLSASATLTELHVRNQAPSAALVNAFVRNVDNTWVIQTCAAVLPGAQAPSECDPDAPAESAPPRGLHAVGTLPLQGDLLAFRPDVHGLSVGVAADRFELATISPLIETPPIVRVAGALTAHARWAASSPRAINGAVQLADGTVDIERLGQPIRDLVLDASSQGRHADIRRLFFRLGSGDREGTFDAHGDADLNVEGDEIAAVRLTARANRLPAIQEGNTYGNVTANVEATGEFRTTGLSARLQILNGSIDVPTQPSRTLQELDPNGQIFVVADSHIDVTAPPRPYPIDLDFHTDRPIWARRSDFEISLRADGHVHFDPAGLALSGALDQGFSQSYFELFGKRFYFDRISIRFDGSTTFNPILDVLAHFDSPSAGRITVAVTERYTAPDIRFASERYPAASQSDVIALIVLGRTDTRGPSEGAALTEQAGSQAAQLLSGLALGFATNQAETALRENRLQIPFLQRIIVQPGGGANNIGRYGGGGMIGNRVYVETTYGDVTPFSGSVTPAYGAVGQEGRLFIEWSATDHISIGTTATYQTTSNAPRFGLDFFFTP